MYSSCMHMYMYSSCMHMYVYNRFAWSQSRGSSWIVNMAHKTIYATNSLKLDTYVHFGISFVSKNLFIRDPAVRTHRIFYSGTPLWREGWEFKVCVRVGGGGG
jgi:hypothetical protein